MICTACMSIFRNSELLHVVRRAAGTPMKQTLTILTFSAALLGVIAMAQIGTSVTNGEHESSPLEVRQVAVAQASAQQRRTHAARGDVERFETINDRISARSERPITPELIDQTLAVAYEIDPELGNQLKSICGDDPADFEHVLRTTGRRLVGLAELRNQAPELYDMKRREWQQEVLIARTVRELAGAKAEDDSLRIQMLENELRTHISIQVALQIAVRGDYLRRLKQQMLALEEEIDRQARRFEQTVEERFLTTLEQLESLTQQDDARDIGFIDFER